MFEIWVARRPNANTQRAYRADVMSFVRFMGIAWPSCDWALLQVSVRDVQRWRDRLKRVDRLAPKTVLRRISSVSRFYEYMREQAADFRIPIVVPNPASKNHIPRESSPPVAPTRALSRSNTRELLQLPKGQSLVAYRGRAILSFYIYTGARRSAGCDVRLEDCCLDGDDPFVAIREKGRRDVLRRVGINKKCAAAIRAYVAKAQLEAGVLFRPFSDSRRSRLASREMADSTMYRIIQSYLEKLPGAIVKVELPGRGVEARRVYTPHSLRATTATLANEAGEHITDMQALLGHRDVKTTHMYIKRELDTKESASHRLRI